MYEVQDEDDSSRVLKVDSSDIRKLDDVSQILRRGDRVLAVFPETTSFYSGIVAKNPKSSGETNIGVDVVVRFDDDEDDEGNSVARKVPSRFILPLSSFDDNDSDV